jgi:hypothetical protein
LALLNGNDEQVEGDEEQEFAVLARVAGLRLLAVPDGTTSPGSPTGATAAAVTPHATKSRSRNWTSFPVLRGKEVGDLACQLSNQVAWFFAGEMGRACCCYSGGGGGEHGAVEPRIDLRVGERKSKRREVVVVAVAVVVVAFASVALGYCTVGFLC